MKMDRRFRMTRQRKVILGELKKVVSHPTADEVYRMVRKRLPHVSLGTIYRNLETLSDTGMILKLEMAGTQRRYDATTDNHYHIRCIGCGKVEDFSMQPVASIMEEARKSSAYEIRGHRLEFEGVCPQCKPQEAHLS